jgi:hypothetical protein
MTAEYRDPPDFAEGPSLDPEVGRDVLAIDTQQGSNLWVPEIRICACVVRRDLVFARARVTKSRCSGRKRGADCV